jgi:flagellar hook-basal body complex protein FliE
MTLLAPIAATAVGSLAEAATAALTQAPRAATAAEAAGASFGDVLKQFVTQTVDSVKQGEAAAISGVEGKASAQNVVSAVMAAERDLQTAIALRDKAVGAYQEISRMAI